MGRPEKLNHGRICFETDCICQGWNAMHDAWTAYLKSKEGKLTAVRAIRKYLGEKGWNSISDFEFHDIVQAILRSIAGESDG